ncbi:amino acid adenylation domain-containing protein [Acidicapsa dinghuensis]|uniref:Amino acid adenylation domain-containing protein n=2 Tax=Acidicapsa dinghuensis TaxID=2218256 RepID=A0ABW1EIP0_9BACT
MRDAHPSSIALSYGVQQLTYEELVCKADLFSRHLIKLGLSSGQAVAICMERSFEWIVAALGVMQAGAAYVPLDPAWPDARLQAAVRDSGARVLVARTCMLNRLQLDVIGLDPARDAAEIAAAPEADRRVIDPQSLAYIIYTSGTTGVPKGVEITHANLDHLIRWHESAFHVTPDDRCSHLAGLGFDAAVWEIWPNLNAGACLCLAGEALRTSPELLQSWLIRERITIAFVPTVLAARLIQMEWPATVALRFLLTGGDALLKGPTSQLPFEVINNYGPTECTVVATSALLKTGATGTPPIGRSISGTNVYLLNERGEQVEKGSEGEIYIGGDGVGRGYRNLPVMTQEYFLADPFTGSPTARMYRSGDRGIEREDGEIEFRGRYDRQVKIRGYRVELDEISTALNGHHAIDFATSIVKISNSGENQLVAYVLFKDEQTEVGSQELQEHLLRSLPDYMIPSIFVRLRSLPISSSGKLDLKKLDESSDLETLDKVAAVQPSTPTEEKLLGMVRDLLGNQKIGIDDNFFLAGGHSLLGMQLVMRLRQIFDVDLTLSQLFKAPTARRLAVVLETLLVDAIDAMSDEEAEAYLSE